MYDIHWTEIAPLVWNGVLVREIEITLLAWHNGLFILPGHVSPIYNMHHIANNFRFDLISLMDTKTVLEVMIVLPGSLWYGPSASIPWYWAIFTKNILAAVSYELNISLRHRVWSFGRWIYNKSVCFALIKEHWIFGVHSLSNDTLMMNRFY